MKQPSRYALERFGEICRSVIHSRQSKHVDYYDVGLKTRVNAWKGKVYTLFTYVDSEGVVVRNLSHIEKGWSITMRGAYQEVGEGEYEGTSTLQYEGITERGFETW